MNARSAKHSYQEVHTSKVRSLTRIGGQHSKRLLRYPFGIADPERLRQDKPVGHLKKEDLLSQKSAVDSCYFPTDTAIASQDEESYWRISQEQVTEPQYFLNINITGTIEDLDHPDTRKLLNTLTNQDIMINWIQMHIASYGGSSSTLFALYNIIKSLKIPVVTIANSIVASAGTILFMLGEKRYVYPETIFLFHRGNYYQAEGNEFNLKNMIDVYSQQTMALYSELFAPYFSKEQMDIIQHGADFYITGKQALECGLATNEVGDDNEEEETNENENNEPVAAIVEKTNESED